MRLSIACMLALLVPAIVNVAAATPRAPDEVIKTTAEAVIARVSSDRDALRSDPRRLHSLVYEMIVPYFDFPRMAQWVLGKHWRQADGEQQVRFVEEFRNLLVRTYAHALLEYGNLTINYHPVEVTEADRMVTVRTDLEQPGTVPVPITYRMHVKDGEWKVFDVAVDGVSLITTYRASFAAEVRKNGVGGLIENLAARNAAAVERQ